MTDDLSMIERAAYDRGFFDGFRAGCHTMREDLEAANAKRAKAILERNKAIEELRSMSDNCFCCRWADGNSCKSPNPCLVDGNPDRWEWRRINEEKQYGD